MTRLAVLVSVADYKGINKLPACRNDGEAMAALVTGVGVYDDYLRLSEDCDGARVKEELASFVKKHRGSAVEELFFYFSGHGDYDQEDYYYLLRDYDGKRRAQTSLQNTELDGLVRTLSPALTVKCVDACYSGQRYIKDPTALGTYLEKSKGGLGSCYFLFSSHSDQESFQDDTMSLFTRSLITAVTEHAADRIRYKDLIDHISDDFGAGGVQRPYFITQAGFTEVFCEISAHLRSSLRQLLGKAESAHGQVSQGSSTASSQLVAAVAKDAERYVTLKEAEELLASLPTRIQLQLHGDAVLKELFDFATALDASPYDPRRESVAAWLLSEGSTYHVRAQKPPSAGMIRFVEGRAHADYISFEITAKPKFPNLEPLNMLVIPVISQVAMRLFYSVFASPLPRSAILDWSMIGSDLKPGSLVDRMLQDLVGVFERLVSEDVRARLGTDFQT